MTARDDKNCEVPREILERLRPAAKRYAIEGAQAVLKCQRGELPAHYLETLQQDELARDALLCAVDDILSVTTPSHARHNDGSQDLTPELGYAPAYGGSGPRNTVLPETTPSTTSRKPSPFNLPLRTVNVSGDNEPPLNLGWCVVDSLNKVIAPFLTQEQAAALCIALNEGTTLSATARRGDRRLGLEDRRSGADRRVAKEEGHINGRRAWNRRRSFDTGRRGYNRADGGKQT